jgi:predicted transposase YdaD
MGAAAWSFPELSREDIAAMLNLGDYKKSRVYKETREERDAEWIKKLSERGFTAENIAQTMGLELDVVKKILKKKQPKK